MQRLSDLGQSAAIYGVGRALGRFVGLLTLPLLTDRLTPADFGIVGMLALVAFVATPLFTLGLGAGMSPTYYRAARGAPRHAVVWTACAMATGTALLLLALTMPLSGSLAGLLFGAPGGELVTLTLVAVACGAVGLPFSLHLQFDARPLRFVVLSALGSATGAVAIVLLVVAADLGVRGYVLGNLLGQALSTLLYAGFAGLGRQGLGWNGAAARRLARDCLPLVPSFGFVFVLQESGKLFLQRSDGLAEVGMLNIAATLAVVVNFAVGSFASAWPPFFMSYDRRPAEAAPALARAATWYVLAIGALVVGFAIFARPLTLLFAGPGFLAAAPLIGPLALAYFLGGVFTVLLPGIYYAGEVRYVAAIQAASCVLFLVVAPPLIQAFAAQGAVLAQLIGAAAMAALLELWGRRRGYLRVPYDWPRLGLMALVGVAFAVAAAALVGRWTAAGWPEALGLGAAFVLAWAALLRPEERAGMLAGLRR